MADAGPPMKKLEEELVWLIGFLIIVGAAITELMSYFQGVNAPSVSTSWFREHLPFFKLVTYFLSALFLFGIIWSARKLSLLNQEIHAYFHPPVPEVEDKPVKKFAGRWERVMSHLNSQNPNDWKFAILEADIMLADLLDILGYSGSTMSDKLKSVDNAKFKSIEAAWEGHKIRNTIAHEGAEYVLSEREARRVIELYRVVFEEFNMI